MKVFGLWHGGSNYRMPYTEEREEFNSLAAAKEEFISRFENINGETPLVGEDASMSLSFYDPMERILDPYPDYLIEIGPRGGIQINRL